MSSDLMAAFSWYLAVQSVTLATLPLALAAFPRLVTRGYALSKGFGLLLISYGLWLGSSFGLVANVSTTVFLLVVVAAVATWSRRPLVDRVPKVWREQRGHVVFVEVLFVLAFACGCVVRSYLPDIAATEKPMELAFLNAVMRTEHFPPQDPWLAGYPISYYYFGYVQAGVLALLSGVRAAVAYNLMLATVFALTAIGAFGVGYELAVAGPQTGSPIDKPSTRGSWLVGGLAALFTSVLGNWEGVLELFHARGIGGSDFWQSIAIKDLNHPYVSSTGLPTDSIDNWWWFRAARVISTTGADGRALDYTINEFPAFSFVLGDLHPHVLALPFVFVALALALDVLRRLSTDWLWLCPHPGRNRGQGDDGLLRSLASTTAHMALAPVAAVRARQVSVLATALVIGGLGFLNAWDLPTYLFVTTAALWFSLSLDRASGQNRFASVAGFAWTILLASLLMYLPYYLGLRSQASGLALVPIRTQALHFAIFWGPLLTAVAAFLIVAFVSSNADRSSAARRRFRWLWPAVGVISILGLAPSLPAVADLLADLGSRLEWLLPSLPIHPLETNLPIALRAESLVLIVPLLAAALVVLDRLASGGRVQSTDSADRRAFSNSSGLTFSLILAATGLMLLLGTEIVFVRDLFGNRMNTVFKLYYQAWILLAIAAAYGIWWLIEATRSIAARGNRILAACALVVAIAAILPGFVYLPMALTSRISVGARLQTLDGLAWFARSNPADAAAAAWLEANIDKASVVVEASGGSYTSYGRVSSSTGLPTILGWEFHEVQWRGNANLLPKRLQDLDAIYRSGNQAIVSEVLNRYGAKYIYLGALEREKYGKDAARPLTDFTRFMDVAYQRDGVTVFRVPD